MHEGLPHGGGCQIAGGRSDGLLLMRQWSAADPSKMAVIGIPSRNHGSAARLHAGCVMEWAAAPPLVS